LAPPPRPHLLARSRFAELADRAMAASWRGPNRRPPLEPEFLWRKGSAGFWPGDETFGREADDVADFRERLAIMCEALNGEARLNALGHASAYGQLKAAIRTRHKLGRLWRERPALLDTELAPPIIVVGQMRSGTTRVHRLLAADPAHSATRMCNTVEPVPRRPDTRALRCALGLALARQVNPWLDTLHPFGATRPDEEIGWLSWSLNPCAFEAQWRIPSFVVFSEARDPAPVYRELARILRSDAALMRDGARPRVLKCPQYAEDLPALLAQFPDARVVATRRDTDEVLASTISVVASQMAWQSDHAALEWIEAEWRRKLALREARTEAALAGFRGPLAEVEFSDFNRDWRGAMTQAYAALGLDLTPAALAAMEKEQAVAKNSVHRLHEGIYRQAARA
jgi:hypothetical protein